MAVWASMEAFFSEKGLKFDFWPFLANLNKNKKGEGDEQSTIDKRGGK